MSEDRERVVCQTPTPGKKPTRIDRWKYQAVRRAVLEALPGPGGEGLEFNRLADRVGELLDADERRRLGSVPWYTTTVKLDLEVQGEIERVPGAGPQRLRRTR